ncbi:MAG: precorrin-6A/cobalt-precorrin-6A reductase [Sulfitobacter sp.]
MRHDPDVLLLAGSAEARQIAKGLLARGLGVQALMSEPPRGSEPMPVPYEVVGEDLDARVADLAQGARVIVDACHGFDAAMTTAGARAAKATERPLVSVTRPAWDVAESPLWESAADMTEAIDMIPSGARVFAATGWESLPACRGFRGEVLMLRQTTHHDKSPPLDFVELAFGDAPFSVAGEITLFERMKVDTVVCRNLGGLPSRPKLEAALALGIQVILIERPTKPAGVREVATVDAALDWVADHV